MSSGILALSAIIENCSDLTQPKTINIYNTMKEEYHKEMDIIEYEGREWQVVSLSDATEPGSCGGTEILYKIMDRVGNVIDVMDYEILSYNARKAKQI